jgi:hypothetical protein
MEEKFPFAPNFKTFLWLSHALLLSPHRLVEPGEVDVAIVRTSPPCTGKTFTIRLAISHGTVSQQALLADHSKYSRPFKTYSKPGAGDSGL